MSPAARPGRTGARGYSWLVDILALMRERAAQYDCPKCRLALRDCGLVMLRDDAPQFTVQVTCATCHVSFVVVVQVRDRDGVDADTPATPVGPPPRPPISGEEVLDLHELLRDHSGPLNELFAPDRSRR